MKLHSVEFYHATGSGYRVIEPGMPDWYYAGHFYGLPKDMLRYDGAFVSDRHVGIVAFPHFTTKEGLTDRGAPTEGRWRSFSVKLTRITKVVGAQDNQQWHELKSSLGDGSWYGIKWTRKGGRMGTVDYLDLRAVPFEAALTAKKPEDAYAVECEGIFNASRVCVLCGAINIVHIKKESI